MVKSNSPVVMPRHRREVNSLISQVGRLQNRGDRLIQRAKSQRAPHQAAISRINIDLEASLAEINSAQSLLMTRITKWCDAKWQILTRGQSRKVTFATGTFRRANNLSAISLASGVTDKKVVDFLRGRRRSHLRKYVRPDYLPSKRIQSRSPN